MEFKLNPDGSMNPTPGHPSQGPGSPVAPTPSAAPEAELVMDPHAPDGMNAKPVGGDVITWIIRGVLQLMYKPWRRPRVRPRPRPRYTNICNCNLFSQEALECEAS